MCQYYRNILLTQPLVQSFGLGAFATALTTFKCDKQAQELPRFPLVTMLVPPLLLRSAQDFGSGQASVTNITKLSVLLTDIEVVMPG